MQTININKHCCLSGPPRRNWKKRWGKSSERGMPVKLERCKVWLGGGILFPLALLVACQSKQVQKPPVPVKVANVELHAANSGARYSATIIPRTQVELAFKVDGYVEKLQKVRGVDGQMRDLQEGDAIVAGAVLARVRQSEYQVKVKEAESKASEERSAIDASKAQYQEALSAIESSKAQLADAEAAYEKSKLDFDRAQNLFASQSLTKANYDAAKAQFEQATA